MIKKTHENHTGHEAVGEEENGVIYLSDPNIGVKYTCNDKTRSWLRIFFQTKLFHLLVILFVLLDLFIVIFDLVVALSHCGEHDHVPHTLEKVVHKFHYISIAILCLFVVENLLQLYAFGWNFFTHSVLHTLDFTIIVISLILDIVITNDSLGEISSILVVVRLWRLARIIHATEHITAFEKETEHHSTHETVTHLHQQLETQKQKVHELQRLLHEHQIKEATISHKTLELNKEHV